MGVQEGSEFLNVIFLFLENSLANRLAPSEYCFFANFQLVLVVKKIETCLTSNESKVQRRNDNDDLSSH